MQLYSVIIPGRCAALQPQPPPEPVRQPPQRLVPQPPLLAHQARALSVAVNDAVQRPGLSWGGSRRRHKSWSATRCSAAAAAPGSLGACPCILWLFGSISC